ncbi:MAG: SDR family oxidoreductase [Planctomycetota bacterium]
MDLNAQRIVITGASRGLGRALALELAPRDTRLLLVARDPDTVAGVAAEVRDRGGHAEIVAADVGDKHAIHAIAAAAHATLDHVDALIHNAGTLGPPSLRPLAETACEDLQRAIDVHVLGPFRLTKALAGPMLLRRRGLIMHVTSDAATEAYPDWGAYGASKAAFDQLSRIWAAELDGTGVRFLAVDPGEMDTALHHQAVPDADRASLAQPDDVAARLVARLGQPAPLASGSLLEVQR